MTSGELCSVSFVLMGAVYFSSSYSDAQVKVPPCDLFDQSAGQVLSSTFSGFVELFAQYIPNPLGAVLAPASLDIQIVPLTNSQEGSSPQCFQLQKKFNIGIISALVPLAILAINRCRV